MKLTGDDLRKVVSKMVREELERILPSMISERISEMYIRSAVLEAVGGGTQRRAAPASPPPKRRARNNDQIMAEIVRSSFPGNDEEELPKSNPLLEGSNPLRSIYEGTVPIDVAEEQGTPDVPLEAFGFESNRWSRNAGL